MAIALGPIVQAAVAATLGWFGGKTAGAAIQGVQQHMSTSRPAIPPAEQSKNAEENSQALSPGDPKEPCEKCEDEEKKEQKAKNAKRMSTKELEKAAKNNDFKDAHDLKKEFGLDAKSDIFKDADGNMYSGPRQGTGTPQPLGINIKGTAP